MKQLHSITRAWGIVVNPSVVWGDIANGKLSKPNGNFEISAGVVYHFKTSNGTNHFIKPLLYSQDEIDSLNNVITQLRNKPAKVVEKVVTIEKEVNVTQKTYSVSFTKNSSELTDDTKAVLDNISENATVNIIGSTSPEGSYKRNAELSTERAKVVADYLKSRNVNVESAVGNDSGRVAVITIK